MALVAALSSTFVLENVAGDVSYAPTPPVRTVSHSVSLTQTARTTCTTPKVTRVRAQTPVVRLNDNYKGSRSAYVAHGKYNYLHFPDGPRPPKENSPCGLTHTVSTTRLLKAATAGPGTFR